MPITTEGTTLSTIGGIDPSYSSMITFDLKNFVPHLPSQVAFLIQFTIMCKNIHRTVVDEGASTCIMFVAC